MFIKIDTSAKYTQHIFIYLLISIIYSMYMEIICTFNCHLKYDIFGLNSDASVFFH